MQIEGGGPSSPGRLFCGSNPQINCQMTPSTEERSNCNENTYMDPQIEVQEFSLDQEMCNLTKMINHSSLNQKENEKHATDRFIPLRKANSMRIENFTDEDIRHAQKKVKRGEEIGESKVTLDQIYKTMLLGESNNSKLFSYGQTPIKGKKNRKHENIFQEPNAKIFSTKNIPKRDNVEHRKISKTPFKVLDAPNLQDDFYLNLLQWSPSNILSVALDSSLYLWNANNNKVLRFCDLSPRMITSLTWNTNGSQISIGNNQGVVQIWDLQKNAKIMEMYGHTSRVSSLSWSNSLLASGSRDRTICLRDARIGSHKIVQTYQGHAQQVCGLKWSFDGQSLASGGNDNKLIVWNTHSKYPVNKFHQHCAAVKGIAWSPHNHGILASGGGSADRTIKFWNTLDGTLLDSIDTGSQICNLIFSKTTKQFVSTHGYSNNEIVIWKYPTLEKVSTLTGHTSRVLYLTMNPSGQTIVTGAGDQTLRFWNAFPSQKVSNPKTTLLSTLELR